MSRWRSPVLRLGIVSLIAFFTKEYLSLEIPNEALNTIVDVVLGLIFPAVAVANNPIDEKNF